MSNQHQLIRLARFSLAFVWFFTAFTSVFFAKDLGYEILASSSIQDGLADVLLYGGSILDLVLGIWVVSAKRSYLCGLAQISVILLYSMLLSIIEPNFWLHPFGPLTKNVPILVLILFVMSYEKRNANE